MSKRIDPSIVNISTNGTVNGVSVPQTVTTRDAALILGITLPSVQNMCDKHELTVVRTPGKHRRIPLSEVLAVRIRNSEPRWNDTNTVIPTTLDEAALIEDTNAFNALMSLERAGMSNVTRAELEHFFLLGIRHERERAFQASKLTATNQTQRKKVEGETT